MKHYEYEPPSNENFIPDVVLTKIEGSWLGEEVGRNVWFKWRGTEQFCHMNIEDGYWLITDTEYTDEFDEWLENNLDNYDSLEYMFDVSTLIPSHYSIVFEEDN
jgi:hypothetical protein